MLGRGVFTRVKQILTVQPVFVAQEDASVCSPFKFYLAFFLYAPGRKTCNQIFSSLSYLVSFQEELPLVALTLLGRYRPIMNIGCMSEHLTLIRFLQSTVLKHRANLLSEDLVHSFR